MGLKELLKSLELPQDITRRGFLKATSMAAVLTMVNEARAKQGVRPYIVLETAKGRFDCRSQSVRGMPSL